MFTTRVLTHTTACGLTLASAEGSLYPLTPCCKASATGSIVDDQPAVVCRNCYHEVSPLYGTSSGAGRAYADVATFITELAPRPCPDVHDCATHAVWHLTERDALRFRDEG